MRFTPAVLANARGTPRDVYVYGTGESGAFAWMLLRDVHGVTPKAHIDSFRSGFVGDREILHIDRFLAEADPDALVLIASQFWKDIDRTLTERGWRSHVPFSFAPLSWRDYIRFRAWTDPILGPSPFPVPPPDAPRSASPAAPPFAPPAAEGAAASGGTYEPDEEMLTVAFHDDCFVDLPLTDRCNLRCVYCPHHVIPASAWRDVPRTTYHELLRLLEPYKRVRVELGGGQGETTLVDDWRDCCLPFLERGNRLKMTTNLARPLSWEEAETLSRFDWLIFSLDSLDPAILRTVRVGANPATIVSNLALIRTAAAMRGADGPRFRLHAVVTDRVALDLERLAAFAAAHGVAEVRFIALFGGTPQGGVGTVDSLGRDDLLEVLRVIQRSYERSILNDIHLIVDADLTERLRRALAAGAAPSEAGPGAAEPAPTEPMTRDCYEPWEHLVTFSNGDVAACCYSVARFPIEPGLPDIGALINAEPYRALRRDLLTGQLKGPCVDCVAKPLVPVAAFRKRVLTHPSLRGKACARADAQPQPSPPA